MQELICVDKYHNEKSAYFHVYSNCPISQSLRKNTIWEPHLHRVFEKYVNEDSIVIEAGCHIGSHTIKLGKLCKSLYAFEPLPTSNELLTKNVEANNLSNVIISNCGLSYNFDEVKYNWIPGDNPGGSGLSNNPTGKPQWLRETQEEVNVQLTTIDAMNLSGLDFMKIDVEGYEVNVIRGAMETIKRFRPIIAMEVWADHTGRVDMDYTKSLFQNLIDIDYTVQHIMGPDFLFIPLKI